MNGWIVLIICVTIYNIAELYFKYKAGKLKDEQE